MAQEKSVKVTVNLPQKAIDDLDAIAKEELYGSRGRAIEALIREHQVARALAAAKAVTSN